ncbi:MULTISPECIES: protein phosphatase 2C domain-containing protein [Pseudomonas]|uniref:Protein phosphatase 2C domain-containing protein n=1 Tax=Pseudomonas sessilinigenes TaxID=658629 RepID=A0ABX8MMX7_9PSED|nr:MULTISPECIES: protein phosphatase 2C domain-containing protein [Pseudomonas]AZC25251.1 Phosphoprotein phosphatase PppA [Pseudomonas sessilinigenes]QIH05188.1 serine/threonine-protein phosphatase [Pseudomonas sp. BIOMIG1BAC]QXH40684.1 protein phosphatase 2C domain-containing protein [Pseudomonas sessilinigenes]UMZ11970.1 serine/threonine-protein phosphatase [Pseudomonas sp. MPFS]
MRSAPQLSYQSASYSHVGMVRKINEDAWLEAPETGLWLVADGMGGHAAGDYVSSLIVDSLRAVPAGDNLEQYAAALRNGLAAVNAAVREETANRGVTMMGSTVVLLAVRGDQAVCLWAGDSRLYRLRDEQLESISRDHSYVQDLQDSGLLSEAEARVHPRANIVTRAIGVEAQLELSQVDLQVQAGDTFLLCSDGLNKTAEDFELRDVLSHNEPNDVVRSLIHLGLTRGAPDNITAIVIKAAGH